MTQLASRGGGRNLAWLRWAGWGGAAALVAAPALAMLVAPDSGVDWSAGDFLFATLMFGIVGLALELTVRSTASWPHRAAAALALATGFLLVWSNLAVGYIGPEDNPYNALFFAVVGLALAGSALVRFRPAGMAWAMLAAGIAHGIAGAAGFAEDPVTAPITLTFVAMWLGSAALFAKAARGR